MERWGEPHGTGEWQTGDHKGTFVSAVKDGDSYTVTFGPGDFEGSTGTRQTLSETEAFWVEAGEYLGVLLI